MVVISSYLHKFTSYTGRMTSLWWVSPVSNDVHWLPVWPWTLDSDFRRNCTNSSHDILGVGTFFLVFVYCFVFFKFLNFVLNIQHTPFGSNVINVMSVPSSHGSIYYRLSIYRRCIWGNSAHSTTISIVIFQLDLHSLTTPHTPIQYHIRRLITVLLRRLPNFIAIGER